MFAVRRFVKFRVYRTHSISQSHSNLSSTLPDLNDSLIVTKSCAKRIKQLQLKADNLNLALRVSVEGGGCSGFQYVFNVEEANPVEGEDRTFNKDGVSVLVDNTSFDLIKGATVDFEQELIRSAFTIVNNPQSESACGCGSSFAVKNFTLNPAVD